MKNIFIHFKSNVLFSISINGEFICSTKSPNQTIDILTRENSQLFFTFSPMSNSTPFLPYSQNIEIINGEIKSGNSCLEIIPFSNNHYLCILKAIPFSLTPHSLITKHLDKTYICINQCYPSVINIYSNNILKNCLTLSSQAVNSVISQKNNCIIIKCLLITGAFEICIIDKISLKCLCQSQCETIEENESYIKYLVRKFINSNYATILTYDTTNQKETSETIFLTKNNHSNNLHELIGYKFLIAVQNNDFKTIKTLCVENISNKLTNSVINQIFGVFQNVYYDPFSLEQPAFILKKDTASFKKITFKFENNKIHDFNIVD